MEHDLPHGDRTWMRKFRDAFRGVKLGVRGQSSFFVHFFVATVVIMTAAILGMEPTEWCLLLVCITIVLAADACAEVGLDLVELPESIRAAIDERVPARWSRGNPCHARSDTQKRLRQQAPSRCCGVPQMRQGIAKLVPRNFSKNLRWVSRTGNQRRFASCWARIQAESDHVVQWRSDQGI